MYGEVTQWGCSWFQLWRQHVEKAVKLNQKLVVVHFNGQVGKGKVASWEHCRETAVQRKIMEAQRRHSLPQLMDKLTDMERLRIRTLSSEQRDDSQAQEPGSEKEDEEERLFLEGLPESDRMIYLSHKGLGNSQKAEVAWLEKNGYAYEGTDVRSCEALLAGSAKALGQWRKIQAALEQPGLS